MVGTIVQVDGQERIRNGNAQGDFYNQPEIGKAFNMYCPNNGGMRVITTSKVVQIICRGMSTKFKVEDGAVFELKNTFEGSVVMVNGDPD